MSPSREPVLSCAHYFPAPATQAIYSVKWAYRRQEFDTWSQSKSGAWYTLLDGSRIFTSCFGRALVPSTKSWKHPTFFHSFISSHLMKSLTKSNEKRNCFLYQHCTKSQLRVHHSSLRGTHYIRYAHAQKLRKRRSSARVPHPGWIWQRLFQLAKGPYLSNILQTTMLFSVKKAKLVTRKLYIACIVSVCFNLNEISLCGICRRHSCYNRERLVFCGLFWDHESESLMQLLYLT